MRELFIQQEDTRYSLRLQHLIERVGVAHILLTLKVPYRTIDDFANTVDTDEKAHYLDLQFHNGQW